MLPIAHYSQWTFKKIYKRTKQKSKQTAAKILEETNDILIYLFLEYGFKNINEAHIIYNIVSTNNMKPTILAKRKIERSKTLKK